MRYIRVPAPPNGSATNRCALSPGRPRYPRATPAPAMYSSPATPGGTGRNPASSTYTRACGNGRPIGTAPDPTASPASTTKSQQFTVPSVGPYALTTRTPGCSARHRSSTGPRNASPPVTSVPDGHTPPAGPDPNDR